MMIDRNERDFCLRSLKVSQNPVRATENFQVKSLRVNFEIESLRRNTGHTFVEEVVEAPDFNRFPANNLICR